MNLTVVHLIQDTGGVSKMLLELANMQAENLMDVYVIHTNLTDDFIKQFDSRIKIIKKEYKFKRPIIFGFNLKKIFNDIKKETNKNVIIHAHNIRSIGFLGTKKIPLITTIHGISWFNNNIRSKISKILVKNIILQIIKSNNKVIGVSNSTSQYYNKMIKKEKLTTIYNGITKKYDKKKTDRFTVGFVGDISKNKGFSYFVECIKRADKKIKFVAAGKILDYNIEFINELEKEYDNFRYLGFVTNAYENIMPNIDILVLPSISEGLPMAIIECFSLGVPVLATSVGGIPEILVDGETGYIIERDSESILDKINLLYKDRIKLNEISEKCYSFFVNKLKANNMYSEYTSMYIEILEGN